MTFMLPPLPPFLADVLTVRDGTGTVWLLWTYLQDRPRYVQTLRLVNTSSTEETL